MDTIRVDIRYRPLRIAWVIARGDFDSFRAAVRLSYALWGGQFNPILFADEEAASRQLINVFQPDMIWPVGESEPVTTFPEKYPHIGRLLLHDTLYIDGGNGRKHAQVLDLNNAITRWSEQPEWRELTSLGPRFYSWEATDPLADSFLIQFGAFPGVEVTALDFQAMLAKATGALTQKLDPMKPIPPSVVERPGVPNFCRFGLTPRWRNRRGYDSPGFFVGNAANLDDLATFWNLRAARIHLLFVDCRGFARYTEVAPAWGQLARRIAERRHEWERNVAVWYREGTQEEAQRLFPEKDLVHHLASGGVWNGLALQPPTMLLGESTVLGAVNRDREHPSVSFALGEKPFSSDVWFHTQHLVVSAAFSLGLYDDDRYTLAPPYLPEVNEGWGRKMAADPDGLRLEHSRLGVVIDATDTDITLFALRTDEVFEQIFSLAGYRATLSAAGLITRQLVAQLGGLQGARVFKLPGVRRLLRAHGPVGTFSRRNALQFIGSRDPDNPAGSFRDYEGLYIESREEGKLQPHHAFGYLVQKGIFRIGADLRCPHCRMTNWVPLDTLRQSIVCEMCGTVFESTRQLAEGEFSYRRSGIMGRERNAQGAVPVALTLQQLDANLSGLDSLYSTSVELAPKAGTGLPTCEIDFVWVLARPTRRRAALILGECKDQGPIRLADFKRDVDNLRIVADAVPRDRFKTFVLLSKLAPFTLEEIDCARALNDQYRLRAILLTAQELEPYDIYEREGSGAGRRWASGTPEALAAATFEKYFKPLGDSAMIGQEY